MMQRLVKRLMLLPLVTGFVLTAACLDGDMRKGCTRYCKCHRGARSEAACHARCTARLRALRKRDRARERQIAECLAAKGERSCDELAACAGDALK
jgi:hypothetical protein